MKIQRIFLIGNVDSSLIRSLKIINAFRLSRIFKYYSYAKIITRVAKSTFSSFILIAFMLILVLFLSSLLGIELFRNKINENTFFALQFDFKSFISAFSVCFNLINLNNWYDMVIIGYKTSNRLTFTIFTIVLIFFGNFVILNLFIALMLEGFEDIDLLKKNEMEELENELYNTLFQNIYNEYNNFSEKKMIQPTEKINKKKFHNFVNSFQDSYKEEDSIDAILDDISDCDIIIAEDSENDEPITMINNFKKQFSLANVPIENTMLLCKKAEKRLQKIFLAILLSSIFNWFIISFIFCSLVLLSIETFYDKSNKTAAVNLQYFALIVNVGFTFEAIIKISSYGFIFGKDSYLRDVINIFEFIIIIVVYLQQIYPKIQYFSFFEVINILI